MRIILIKQRWISTLLFLRGFFLKHGIDSVEFGGIGVEIETNQVAKSRRLFGAENARFRRHFLRKT
jgi:hypothetical protein